MIPNRLLLLLRRPREDNLTYAVAPDVPIFPGDVRIERVGPGDTTWTRVLVAPTDTPIGDGVTYYWDLDETSGTRADSDGGNDLTEHNGVSSVAGVVGNAAQFVHADQTYLSGTPFSLLGDWSISLWFNADSIGGTEQFGHGLIRSMTGENDGDFHIGVRNGTGSNTVYCANYTDTRGPLTRYRRTSTMDGISMETTYHLAITYARSTDTLLFYLNGDLKTTLTDSNFTQSAGWGTGMEIGRTFMGADYYWDGWIDEVAILDGRILTASEVSRVYNDGNGRTRAQLDLVAGPVAPGDARITRRGPGRATFTRQTSAGS